MILEESLKDLRIQVKTGGSIVTHRPTFTPDAKSLLLVTDNKIQIYSTQTFACTGKVSLPTADAVANIALDPKGNDLVVVFTVNGGIFEVDVPSGKVVKQSFIPFTPKGWDQFLLSIQNFVYPSRRQFFLTAFVQGHTLYPTLFSVRETPEIPFYLEKICVDIVNNLHSIAIGAGGDMLVAIQENALYARDVTTKQAKKHLYGDRKLTCVAAHPTDWLCATGDDTGRIILWSNATTHNIPAKTVFHWHTLPLADLSFTIDGSQMVSGGGECTLVKWDVREVENRRTVPRLGLPVRHVSASAKNSLTAVSQADNTIRIIDVHNNVLGTIQNITQCYIPENADDQQASGSSLGGSQVYQAGLHFDPNAHALVMNGRPGQLQSYSFAENKHLYELDITNQNYVTAERHKVIPFIEIDHIAFSKHGRWLATAESRLEDEVHTEVRLKFWKFEASKQKFVLKTSIEWPHENGINSLKIQPIDDNDPTLIAATSGGDNKFKTWGVVHDTSIHGKSEWWNCENVGTHRNHPAGPLCFSTDGSLLAASFAHILTLWATDSHEYLGAFSHMRLQDSIKFVEFGTKSNARLVICCSDSALAVWDVITFSLLWAIPFQAENLAVDPFRGIAVAFSTKRHAYFFSPSSPEPLAVHHNVSKSKVLSSIFVPSDYGKSAAMKSTLVFMNLSHELCAFVPKDVVEEEEAPATIKLAQAKAVAKTPFAQLVAHTTTNDTPSTERKVSPGMVGLIGAEIIKEVINSSPHTMPSISFYCERLLNETTTKVSASERFRKVEELVLASHKRRQAKSSAPVEDDEKMEIEEPLDAKLSAPSLTEPEDLKAIAEEDTSWISKIIFQ